MKPPTMALLQPLFPLCLASSSPQRQRLLAQYQLPFAIAEADIDESPRPGEQPQPLAKRLAREKAVAVRERYPEHGIIAADTLVVAQGQILGKPQNQQHAQAMLSLLSGSTHHVITAYALLDARNSTCSHGRDDDLNNLHQNIVSTTVHIRKLPPDWIDAYLACGEGRGKSGGYALQGLGAAMITGIEGSPSNVVGLPLETLIWDLLDLHWVRWQH